MAKDVDRIKQKLDIVEFIRSYLSLFPAGKNFKGLCPFHQEKTPSFIVSPERQIWHCFGCSLGGDVIKFAMLYENLEFPEALRFLAEKAGIDIQFLSPAEQRELGVLYDIHSEASSFFRGELEKNEEAKAYLKERGLKDKTIDEFMLGFAPGGEALTLHLIKKGFDVRDAVRAGVSFKNKHGLFRDRFEGRIIFPIANAVGKMVAFTGRILPRLERNDASSPKYLNSPETPIFNKSKILYGFDKAKKHIVEKRAVFLVEGQMDALMAWQSGIKNVSAVSGTGLSRNHLESLRRIADAVVVSFDNDAAGMRALERAVELFGQYDFLVKSASLGSFKDPADAARHDAGFLVNSVKEAIPAFLKIIRRYFDKKEFVDIVMKKRAVRRVLELIKSIRSSVERGEWIRELSKESGIGEASLLEEFANISEKTKEEILEATEHKKKERADIISERLLAIAFTDENFLAIIRENNEFLPESYAKILLDKDGKDAEFAEMRASFEFSGESAEKIEKECLVLIDQLKLDYFEKKRLGIKQRIRSAEMDGDEKELESALTEFSELTKKIDAIKK